MSEKTFPARQSVQLTGILALVIVVIIFLVYIPALKNDFVNWDDGMYVYKNTNIRSLNSHSLYWMVTSLYAGNWHPLTWFSHAADYAVWGLNPFGHHLTNVILHGLNTLLVFLLVIQLMLRVRESTQGPSPSKTTLSVLDRPLIAAGVTALLFGLHPLPVESVVWVSERKDLLCASFFLLTILFYLYYTCSVVNKHRWAWCALCLVLFILALMSKPMAVTLPFILLLLDFYPLERLTLSPRIHLSVLLEKVPFFALSIASSVITIIAQHSGGAVVSLEILDLKARLLNSLSSLVFYLNKMAVPVNLVPFYPFPTHINWFDLPYVVATLQVLVITGVCLWMVRKGRYLLFTVCLYYLVTLFPVIGIIKVGIHAAADRYTYLPSVSIFLLMGISVAWVFEKSVVKRLLAALICVCMVLLGQLTVTQIRVWQNSEVMWSYVISVFPKSAYNAYNNLGNAYYEKGELDKAIYEYNRALSLKTNYAGAYNNLGIAYADKGMVDEAIAHYKKALAINPNYAEAHYSLGNTYVEKGEPDNAISEYKKAIDIKPDYADAHNNLGLVYEKEGLLDKAISHYQIVLTGNPNFIEAHNNLGIAYADKDMVDEAILNYKKALALDPNFAEAHYNLGNAYVEKGESDNAISEYEKALAIKPDYAKAHYILGLVYYKKGSYEKAITECTRSLLINPDDAYAHNYLGASYVKKGRVREAIAEFSKAIVLEPGFADAHNNLGLAYFKTGRLDDAISEYTQALAINPTHATAHKNLGDAYSKRGKIDFTP